MITSDISLIDVKPKQNAPSAPLLNVLANQILDNLETCRGVWWSVHRNVCLDNKPVLRSPDGKVLLTDKKAVGQIGKVVAGSGAYNPTNNEVNANVAWKGNRLTCEKIEG